MSQPPPKERRVRRLVLEDPNAKKQQEALRIELDRVKEELVHTQQQAMELAKRLITIRGVDEIGLRAPAEVHALYYAIEKAIEAFLVAMRAAAVNPDTDAIDIWRGFIWRFLLQCVFSHQGIIDFYQSEKPENASYYIQNINKLEYLVKQANPPVFGLYARRLWKRQALSAIFLTADFACVRSVRAAKVEDPSAKLRRAFHMFARPFPEGQAVALVRAIVSAAVDLNEHIMTEADDIWTLELDSLVKTDGDLYDNMADFDLRGVGSEAALDDAAPLNGIEKRLSRDLVREEFKFLCVVTSALRYQHVQADGEGYMEPVVTCGNARRNIGPGPSDVEVEAYMKTFVRWHGNVMYQPRQKAAWREIPVAFIQASNDMTVPINYQQPFVEEMEKAERKVQVFELATGHCPNFTATDGVVDAVNKVVSG